MLPIELTDGLKCYFSDEAIFVCKAFPTGRRVWAGSIVEAMGHAVSNGCHAFVTLCLGMGRSLNTGLIWKARLSNRMRNAY